MLTVRPSHNRGHADHGWLDSRHTFSFADYHDPRFMGFGALRVINEDRVQPGRGFDTHGHQDMEIVSYVIDGELAHKDSLGTGAVIRPGDVQRMSAGTGVRHSEFNPSRDASVHFLQIWVLPARTGQPPGYEQKSFSREDKTGRLKLVASQQGRDGSVTIGQDVDLYATIPQSGQRLEHALAPGRRAWVQVVCGGLEVNGISLTQGDGAALSGEPAIVLAAASADTEVLLFDMAN